jgi:hypothetical protein
MAQTLASGAGGSGLPLEPVLDVSPARWASDLYQLARYDLRMTGKSPICDAAGAVVWVVTECNGDEESRMPD